MSDKKEIVSRDKLQEAAVYFGHKKDKWNPKMKPYIATIKKGTHILDVDKTKRTLEFAYSLIKNFANKGAKFVFVGTKKQAKATVKENALRTNSYYVTERWLGGTLTNSRTIFQRVRRMEELEKLQASSYEGYTKKEGLLLERELSKLQKNLSGIRTMKYKPNVMIVADMASDKIAIKEAKRLGVKVISLADTNDDPSFVDIAIPANNDSVKSITLVLTILADAIAEGKGGQQLFAYQSDESIVLPEEFKKERRFPKRNFRRHSNFRPNNRTFQKRDTNRTDSKPNTTPETKPTVKPEVKVETTQTKPTVKPEVKVETTQTKPEVNTEVKVETPKTKPEVVKTPDNDYESMTVVKLKEILKEKTLPTSGKKSELIERIKGA